MSLSRGCGSPHISALELCLSHEPLGLFKHTLSTPYVQCNEWFRMMVEGKLNAIECTGSITKLKLEVLSNQLIDVI